MEFGLRQVRVGSHNTGRAAELLDEETALDQQGSDDAQLVDQLGQASVAAGYPRLAGSLFSAETIHPASSATIALSSGRVRLSIIMPAFNEARTIERAITQLMAVPFPCPFELIVVDDGSSDETPSLLARVRDPRVRVHRHRLNRGKGAALLTGMSLAEGSHVVPFDADLEYAPQDLLALLRPVLAGRSEVVYGSRLFGANTVFQSYRYAMGNKLTTLFANVLFDAYISDLHTCLKLLPLDLLRSLDLREERFGLDTEVTARLLKLGYRPFEVPISYHSRTHAQGKKLSWRDGLSCLAILIRVRSERRFQPGVRREMKQLRPASEWSLRPFEPSQLP